MQDLCAEYPFPNFTINDETDGVDRLVLGEDGLDGLAGGSVRRNTYPRGQDDGVLLGTAKLGARIVTWKGAFDIQSMEWDLAEFDTWRGKVNTLMATVRTSLEGILNSNHTLLWTPQGLSQHSLVVRYCAGPGGELKFGGTMRDPTFTFTTISADPTITVS